MNGYKKILYEAQRELAKCHREMEKAKADNLKTDYAQWVRRSMECERTTTWIEQQLRGSN